MADVNGTAGADFIHRLGDGLLAPDGTTDLVGVTQGDDLILAGKGDDWVYAGNGNDALYGGGGNDYLNGGLGDDAMFGGAGDDTYVVNSALDIVEDSGGGNDLIQSSVDFTLSGLAVERMTLIGAALIGTGNGLGNRLQGNALDNVLSGLGGTDILYGGNGNDSLLGGSGEDVLFGGDGRDTLNGGSGYDAMTGGNGSDLYYVDTLDEQVSNEDVYTGRDTVRASVDFTIGTGVEVLVLTGAALVGTGSLDDNLLVGSAQGNTLSGMAGNDRITGGKGPDLVYGGAGNDTLLIQGDLNYVAGETYDGGADTDVLSGAGQTTSVDLSTAALTGIESLKGFAAGLSLTGAQAVALSGTLDTGALTLTTGGAVDLSDTRILTDTINLTTATDLTVSTGDGATGLGGGFDGTINGSSGADTITIIGTPNPLGVVINGGNNDTIFGSAGDETITGGIGSEIHLGGGRDTVTLGSSSTIYLKAGAQSPDLINLSGNSIRFFSEGTGTIDLAQTVIIFLAQGNGTSATFALETNVILNATQFGAAFREISGTTATITGSTGAAIVVNSSKFSFATTTLAEGANPWNVTLTGDWYAGVGFEYGFNGTLKGAQTVANNLTLIDKATITLTSFGSNTLVGGTQGDTLTSASGADSLDGAAGNDLLAGAGGNDTLVGGAGNDTLNGGSQVDSLYGGGDDDLLRILATGTTAGALLNGGAGADTLDGTGASATVADLTGVTLSGIETLTGFAGGVKLTLAQLAGFSTVDVSAMTLTEGGLIDLSAMDFNAGVLTLSDTATELYLSSGDAGPGQGGGFGGTVQGGLGDDTLTVFAGLTDDYFPTVNGGDGNDSLESAVGATLSGQNGFDTLGGSSAGDLLYGGADADWIRGNGGVDTISGGSGNDTVAGQGQLKGDQGNDRITGSTGHDTFEGGAGNDTLNGSLAGQSDLFVFGSNATGGTDTVNNFKFGGATTDAILIRNGITNATYIDAAFFSAVDETEVRYDGSGKFQVDLDGDGTSDYAFTLVGITDWADLDQSYFLAA